MCLQHDPANASPNVARLRDHAIHPAEKPYLLHCDSIHCVVHRCTDDWGEFYFDNGATVHYTFEHHQEKNIDDARYDHGNETLSFYDAVIVNPGNSPRMTQTHVVELAHELQAIGVPLFWLSSYDGHGDIGLWSEEHRERFTASGAHFVPIGDMARGLKAWTKGSVEGSHSDRHYCLPGPPDEMALLMLKLLWAVYEEKK